MRAANRFGWGPPSASIVCATDPRAGAALLTAEQLQLPSFMDLASSTSFSPWRRREQEEAEGLHRSAQKAQEVQERKLEQQLLQTPVSVQQEQQMRGATESPGENSFERALLALDQSIGQAHQTLEVL